MISQLTMAQEAIRLSDIVIQLASENPGHMYPNTSDTFTKAMRIPHQTTEEAIANNQSGQENLE